MPVMDGIPATKHIRTNGRWKNLPIVAMTANAMAADIERCLQVGMNGHLSKPIEVDKFYQVLKQFLKSTNTAPQNNHTIDTTSLLNEVITVSQSDLPTLTGIDLEQAIFRIGGNRKRYFEILRHFIDSQKQEMESLSGLIKEQDWVSATRVAHTLKGSAANLGLDELAQLAAKMENDLEQKLELETELIERVDTILMQVDDELSMWENQHKEPERDASIDWAQWYQQLHQAISDYDVIALNLSKPIRQVTVWNSAQQEALINAIENFDFEQAKQLLESYPAL